MWLFEIKIERYDEEDKIHEEQQFVTANDIKEVIDELSLEFEDEHSSVTMIRRVVPILRVLR